jgi:N-acetylglutamate synthase-like GNAT family acetyltransferase
MWLLSLTLLITGAGLGGVFVFPKLLLEEAAEPDRPGGENIDTSAALAFRVAQAVAVLWSGITLDIFGFDASELIFASAYPVNLGFGLILGIFIPLILSPLFFSLYSIKKSAGKKEERANEFFLMEGKMISLSRIDNKQLIKEVRMKAIGKGLDVNDEFAAHYAVFRNEEIMAVGRLNLVGNSVEIDDVCVLPGERKRGYGDLLTRKLIDLASQKTNDLIIVKSKSPYFIQFGFKEAGGQMQARPDDIVFPSSCGGH